MGLFLAALLASCQQGASSAQDSEEAKERIVIESGNGMFTRRFKLDVSSNGLGTVEWIGFAQREQEVRNLKRAIAFTPEAFARFKAALAPYKPVSDTWIGRGNPVGACESWSDEAGRVEITWSTAKSKIVLGYDDNREGDKVDSIRLAVAEAPKLVLPTDLAQEPELVDVHPANR